MEIWGTAATCFMALSFNSLDRTPQFITLGSSPIGLMLYGSMLAALQTYNRRKTKLHTTVRNKLRQGKCRPRVGVQRYGETITRCATFAAHTQEIEGSWAA